MPNRNANEAGSNLSPVVTHNDVVVVSVVLGELALKTSELIVGRAALSDDASIPSRVVVLNRNHQHTIINEVHWSTYKVDDNVEVWDANRATCTVASYFARKDWSMSPARVGVVSCHAGERSDLRIKMFLILTKRCRNTVSTHKPRKKI